MLKPSATTIFDGREEVSEVGRDGIPPCLELDTLNNQWAFIAVAMVQTKALRPKGFPKMLGNDFNICFSQTVNIDPADPLIIPKAEAFFNSCRIRFIYTFCIVIVNRYMNFAGFFALRQNGRINT